MTIIDNPTSRASDVVARRGRTQIVVVGAGFAGLNAVHALRRVDADVTVVDKNNYHTFQPLLYQVSTGYLAAEEVGTALRSVFRRQANVTVRMAAAVSVNWTEHQLALEPDAALDFDYLIITAGAETNFFGVPGMPEHAWPLYTLNDAVRLRAHLLGALERGAGTPGGAGAGIPISAVVVGGGPTGVETAGALASMAGEVVGPGTSLQVILVEAGAQLLNGFSPQSSRFALADLRRRGVDVRLDQTVKRADPGGVTLAGGERIDTGTVIWAAGVQPSGIGHALGLDVDRHGKIVVDPQLQVTGHPGVFAAGDVAAVTTAGQTLPMLAPVAIQAGRHAGEQVARRLADRPLTAFRYRDKGMMAVLGRGNAVAELPLQPWAGPGSARPLRFAGLAAWLLWLGVHIVYLIGFRNRLKVLVDWGWSYFTSRGAGAILLDIPDQPEAAPTPDEPRRDPPQPASP